MELVVHNKIRQCLSQKQLQRLSAFISPSPGHLHEGSLSKVMDVAIVGFDCPLFVVVVAKEVEFLGEVLVNHDRF